MRLHQITPINEGIYKLLEYGSGITTGAVASVANPINGVISRQPNLFGYIPYSKPTKKRKAKRSGSKSR